MYIGEVVERTKSYFPSEYNDEEMYRWCDEVSAMLISEDRNVFVKETVLPSEDGSVVLPEGVEFENIAVVRCNGKVLDKTDFRTTISGKCVNKPLELVYMKPYLPIRSVTYSGSVKINREQNIISISMPMFFENDKIKINTDGAECTAQVIKTEFIGDEYAMTVLCTNIGSMAESGDVTISRIITDKTVCDAPYDSMYIDYIIAKICMYQRDFDMYNQFMAAFNSRLNAYIKWLVNNLPQKCGKFKNWW